MAGAFDAWDLATLLPASYHPPGRRPPNRRPVAYLIETPRLGLRELTLDDLPFVEIMLSDPVVMRYYPAVLDRDGARIWLEKQLGRYQRDGTGLWLVEHAESGEPLGQVGLAVQTLPDGRHPEVAYLIHSAHHRRGYATEAAKSVHDFAFNTKRYPYVISLIRPENTPSQGVARKTGMMPGKIIKWHGMDHVVWRRDSPAG